MAEDGWIGKECDEGDRAFRHNPRSGGARFSVEGQQGTNKQPVAADASRGDATCVLEGLVEWSSGKVRKIQVVYQ